MTRQAVFRTDFHPGVQFHGSDDNSNHAGGVDLFRKNIGGKGNNPGKRITCNRTVHPVDELGGAVADEPAHTHRHDRRIEESGDAPHQRQLLPCRQCCQREVEHHD